FQHTMAWLTLTNVHEPGIPSQSIHCIQGEHHILHSPLNRVTFLRPPGTHLKQLRNQTVNVSDQDDIHFVHLLCVIRRRRSRRQLDSGCSSLFIVRTKSALQSLKTVLSDTLKLQITLGFNLTLDMHGHVVSLTTLFPECHEVGTPGLRGSQKV